MKKSKNYFIVLFLLTIIFTRFIVYLVPRTNIIYRDNFHHIYIGIVLLGLYFLIKHYEISYYILAITLGLIADQITATPFYLTALINKPLAPHSFWYYWSNYGLISTTIIIIISIFLIKKYLKE